MQAALEDIEKVEKMISAAAQKHVPDAGAAGSASRSGGSSNPVISGRKRAEAKPTQIITAVKEILSGAVHPMSISDLMDALKDRGLPIPGAGPANALGTTLSRHKTTFVNLVRFGYWLRERSYPSVGHYGNSEPEDPDEPELDDRFPAVH